MDQAATLPPPWLTNADAHPTPHFREKHRFINALPHRSGGQRTGARRSCPGLAPHVLMLYHPHACAKCSQNEPEGGSGEREKLRPDKGLAGANRSCGVFGPGCLRESEQA